MLRQIMPLNFKFFVILEENHLTLVAASKYDVSSVKYPNGKESLELTAMMHCSPSGLKADQQRTIWKTTEKKLDEMTELEPLQLRVKELRRENALLKSEGLSRSKRSLSQRDWAEAIQELKAEHGLEILSRRQGWLDLHTTIIRKRLSEPDGYDDARVAIREIYDHHSDATAIVE